MHKNDFVYIFDIDGTLTSAREPINPEFEKFFSTWITAHETYLVTGSDIEKTKEQLPDYILNMCEGVFCCMGNVYFKKDNLIYQNEFKLPSEAIAFLNYYISNSKYPKERMGNIHIENRTGMVNFSVVGRDISLKERELYYEWDLINQERKHIANEFNNTFMINGIEANIGGKISIDIQKIGFDKSQVLNHIDLSNKKTMFFGDKCKSGEIDYPLYNVCDISHEVLDWEECFNIIKNI
jgi:phosphomannomutase